MVHVPRGSRQNSTKGCSWACVQNSSSPLIVFVWQDICHVQFESAIAFKLVWCPGASDDYSRSAHPGAIARPPLGSVRPISLPSWLCEFEMRWGFSYVLVDDSGGLLATGTCPVPTFPSSSVGVGDKVELVVK